MKRIVCIVLACVFVYTGPAFALNFVSMEELREWIESGKHILIVDIQPADQYGKHHFKNSIRTNAYPVMTDADKRRLDKAVADALLSDADVVIVRSGGRLGRIASYNAFDYFLSKEIPEGRLFIMEGSISDWPYEEMLIKGK